MMLFLNRSSYHACYISSVYGILIPFSISRRKLVVLASSECSQASYLIFFSLFLYTLKEMITKGSSSPEINECEEMCPHS